MTETWKDMVGHSGVCLPRHADLAEGPCQGTTKGKKPTCKRGPGPRAGDTAHPDNVEASVLTELAGRV